MLTAAEIMQETPGMYPKVQMFIAGEWTDGTSGKSEDILNPATGQPIGKTPHASRQDLDRALEAAKAGFEIWRKTSPFDRYKLMRKAADIIRSRAAEIAPVMTMEQGKPVVEAQGETMLAGDLIDWFSEEARRAYGLELSHGGSQFVAQHRLHPKINR